MKSLLQNISTQRERAQRNFVFTAAVFSLLLFSHSLAQNNFTHEGVCLSSDSHSTAAFGTDTSLAQKTYVRALAIYVAFPEQPSQLLPEVASRLETELPNFIRCMSEGRQTLIMQTARRPAPFDALCYVADSAMSYYQSKIPEPAPKTKGYEFITDEILTKVFVDYPNFPEQFDVIFLNVLGNFQRGSDGLALLVRGKSWERKYRGLGATIDLTDPEVFLGIVGHEYGHLLGAQHPPHFLEKSFGDYELMDQHLHRLAPYGLQNLLDIGWIAPERVWVVSDTLRDVELEDVRRGGKVLLVALNAEQYFLVANHQGSDYDSVYKGRGLLVWHQMGKTAERKAYSVWDLESAAGLMREGDPDPIVGQDDFDRSRDSTGTAADFFTLHGNARFGDDTNPNTNLYDEPEDQHAWRVQSRRSGVVLANLRQQSSTMILDVFVPLNPPRIIQVKGPNAYVAPASFYGVDVWLTAGNVSYEVELWYRYAETPQFERANMQQLAEGRYSGEIPLRRVAMQVQYYVRVVYGNGFVEFFPPAAPDSSLHFIIKPRLSDIVKLERQDVTLAAGDSSSAALRFDNSSTFPLHLRAMILQQESIRDDRAYDSTDTSQQIFVPRAFLDSPADGNFGLYFEYTPNFYLRLPSSNTAVAKVHVTYDEQWLYLYFVMLVPRTINAAFTLEAVWRTPSFTQELMVTVVGASITRLARPAASVQASFLSDAFGSLPRILLKLPISTLRRDLSTKSVELRARFWSDRYARANWPNVMRPSNFGKMFWQEDTPFFQLSAFEEALQVGEQRTSLVKFRAPHAPWAPIITSWLLITSSNPMEGKYSLPLSLAIENFRSRFDSTGGSAPQEMHLDPKPNFDEPAHEPPPSNFKLLRSFPNPFVLGASALRMRVVLPQADLLKVEICDVLGRVVVNLRYAEFDAGEHEILWDGKDHEAQNVQRGVYFIRGVTSTKISYEKIVVM